MFPSPFVNVAFRSVRHIAPGGSGLDPMYCLWYFICIIALGKCLLSIFFMVNYAFDNVLCRIDFALLVVLRVLPILSVLVRKCTGLLLSRIFGAFPWRYVFCLCRKIVVFLKTQLSGRSVPTYGLVILML